MMIGPRVSQLLVVIALAVMVLGWAAKPRPLNDKIDPAVKAIIDGGQSAQVILLGATQLFDSIDGLARFAQRNRERDRRDLRQEVLAELKAKAAAEQRRILAALARAHAEKTLWIINAMVLTLTPEEVRTASALREVRYIYPATERFTEARASGQVPLATSSRVPFRADGKRIAWNVQKLGAPRVWRELGVVGAGVTVAVLDVGVNYLHTDLRNNVWINGDEIGGNGRDDDHNGYIDDVHGYDFGRNLADVRPNPGQQHGTYTSGIIVGDGTGGIVTGVAPRARIMPLRGGSFTASALAYQYALENGADVLSMSFSLAGLGHVRGLWRRMSDHAVAAGLVLIGGAGNFQQTAALPYQHQSPKDVPSVISVAGVDSLLNLVPFSSLGPAEWGTVALYGDYPMPAGLTKPDLVAFPGAGYPLLAGADSGYVDPNPNIRGNSFSGPQGAGVAALMLSAAPRTPVWRIKEIMEATARDLGEPGKDNRFGAGLLDAFAAVQAVQGR
jgi:subtilisin family serine protease